MTRIRRAARGQALVEFALILPLLVLLLVGILDGGRLVYAYHTVNNAAREAGRQAIVDQTLSHVQERGAGHAVALGIDPDDVTVDYRHPGQPEVVGSCNAQLGTNGIYGCLAVVQVEYSFEAATPVIGALIGPITVVGEVRFPVEFNCQEPSTPSCPVGG
jgi:Flp pilus assembly protein TadG